MILSRESEYALDGLVVLARQPHGKIMTVKEIAEARQLPSGFLARIFQKLRRHKLVSSHRGAVRGYALARPPSEITLREILEAIEGPGLFERCVFRSRQCDAHDPCKLHKGWLTMREKLQRVTDEITLEDVSSRSHAPATRLTITQTSKRRRAMSPSPV